MARPTVRESLEEYGRGVAGGLLFSLPLLYTMEMWWQGILASPERMLGYLAMTFLLLLGYNRFAGIREDHTWSDVFVDSVEEMGIGLVLSAIILFLLGRIGPGATLAETIGIIAIEAATVAIGVSVGTAQLGAGPDEGNGSAKGSGMTGRNEAGAGLVSVQEIVIAICGAVLFAGNIAPTEEVRAIAAGSAPLGILGLMVLSLLVALFVTFYANFVGSRRYRKSRQAHELASVTLMAYAAALATSAVTLWFFGRFDGETLEMAVRQTVVLAFPGALGASAGRLLLQAER
ncbi:MAG TPA: TIGR02587 family membrane protein [Thermoanaerobaculia bacterium]|nr:TIGR02587 family membrane protein [Thermoanaerobaculia bacterium]